MTIERKPFAIRFPADLHEALRVHSFLTGESMAATINRLVRDYVAGPGHEAMLLAANRRADHALISMATVDVIKMEP